MSFEPGRGSGKPPLGDGAGSTWAAVLSLGSAPWSERVGRAS